jgi:hypothetical protein
MGVMCATTLSLEKSGCFVLCGLGAKLGVCLVLPPPFAPLEFVLSPPCPPWKSGMLRSDAFLYAFVRFCMHEHVCMCVLVIGHAHPVNPKP